MRLKRLYKTAAVTLAVTLVMSLFFATAALAAPESLGGGVALTRGGLVTLKVPQYVVSTTTNKRLAISAVAPQGTAITVYRYNAATGTYDKAYLNGAPVEAVVGPTTLFAGQVDLNSGVNKFLIRGATSSDAFTVIRFDVTLLSEGFMDRIRSVIDISF